jgi:hypothetical protein
MSKDLKAIANEISQTPFIRDLDRTINFNGKPMPLGYYNLVISIRDFKLYQKGLKPHRHWKPTHAREYFGIRKRASTQTTINMLEGWRDLMLTKTDQ